MRRAVRVLLFLGAAAVLLEGLLRLGALYLATTGRAADPGAGARRVLCVGDSNTFGFGVDPALSYPAQLEARLPGTEVINHGFPGINSSQARRDLGRLLEAFRPDEVLLLIGVNDFWTVPVDSDDWTATAWRWSRLFRVLYILGRRVGVTAPTWHAAHTPQWHAALSDNVGAMQEAAAAARVRLVLLTYPQRSEIYAAASAEIRLAAARHGLPLIDVGAAVAERCRTRDCASWFQPDGHPTAEGYQHMSEIVAAGLDDR